MNTQKTSPGSKGIIRYFQSGNHYLDLLFFPGLVLIVLFQILPLFGLGIVFVDYIPARGILGSTFVGLENIRMIFSLPEIWGVIRNTFRIALLKIAFGFPAPILFALLLNEIRFKPLKKIVQTFTYFPFFLSWIILAGIIGNLFALDGLVNTFLIRFGFEEVFFLGEDRPFLFLLIASDVWKGFGWGSIIYLAALTGIDPTLYEAAMIDGANRWHQTIHITLPGIMAVVLLTAILQLGNMLNAGFDQIFNLYNPSVYRVADIIETYSFRMAFVGVPNYVVSTTIGFLKGIVSSVFILSGWYLAHKYSDYRIF